MHSRIHSIELAIRESGVMVVSINDAGANLRLGRVVIADSVNPLPVTRDAWFAVAAGRAGIQRA
jgi:predicted kinase